jgi:hypothetical protein
MVLILLALQSAMLDFVEVADSKGVVGCGEFLERLGTPPPGVFGKGCAGVTKQAGWAKLRMVKRV